MRGASFFSPSAEMRTRHFNVTPHARTLKYKILTSFLTDFAIRLGGAWLSAAVCTENSSSGVVVMKSAQDAK
jgi:hypothetical protein